MDRMKGKVALITGAGTGIGRATAELFVAEGAAVVIADFNPELGRGTEELIKKAGGEALFVETNVTDDASVANAVQQTVKRFGKLNVLHNCAGGSIAEDGAVTDVDLSVWNHTLSLDLLGPILCCRHAIPEMVKAGGGSIVNMSSTAALQGVPIHIYSAAKGGVISLTRSLASQYAKDQIRANAICPGIVLTDRIKGRFGAAPSGGSDSGGGGGGLLSGGNMLERYPFGIGQAIDIAQVALFLAADESRMVNGAILAADGGMSAY